MNENKTKLNAPPIVRWIKEYLIEDCLFGTKWLLVPFYFGLVVVQILYFWKFSQQIVELVSTARSITESQMMLTSLSLIDAVMIANLIKMIIVGSYQTFICKVADDLVESKVSSGGLKVKMASSIIVVSSIHLLQTFINPANITKMELVTKCGIHSLFLVGTLMLALVDYIHEKTKWFEYQIEKDHKHETV